jgi:ATP-dependent Lon protease
MNEFLSPIIDDDEMEAEFIPLLSSSDEEQMNAEQTPEILPILPLRNTVLFPGVVIPITVGRDKSIKLIKDAYKGQKLIGVVSQKDSTKEDPLFADLNKIGTIAYIVKMLRMPDGSTTVIIQGRKRFQLGPAIEEDPYIKAEIKPFSESKPEKGDKQFLALVASIKDIALQIIKQSPHIPSEAGFAIKNIESHSFLINFVSSNMNAKVEEKQQMLELPGLQERATMLLSLLTRELQMLELKNQIQNKVKTGIDQQQREYFLNQQLKTIQEELGANTHEKEVEKLRQKGAKKKWTKVVAEVFKKEVDKLARMNPNMTEFSVQRNYVELLLDLPWNYYTKDNFDLKRAQRILEKDHYGLEEVKERVLEYLAVLKLKGDMKSPILCLVGPPGVGKTSLGKSIAKALNRRYVRLSLGGVHDEAEIRGHRRTYIGAMPGRIIQNIKKAKTSNPVFVLDEIDKLSYSAHGDPSSAMLEVLDPEQNTTFNDNYIELDYDLSKVLFIATANTLSGVQPALKDRMEVIEVTGYTVEEKIEIAKRHLLPKQLEAHGIKKNQLIFDAEIMEKIIDNYTRESGVRSLEKRLAKVIRGIAKKIVFEESFNPELKYDEIEKILGPPMVYKEKYQGNDVAGVVTGLAWTAMGGDILFIEVSLSKGKGNLTLTGNLGEVMKESASIALEYVRAHASVFGIDPDDFEKYNVHMHVPEGATPKDGPSAGITMLTALVSAFTKRKVKEKIAMTGEITLRGRVLPVGGIKEKILAAKRAEIKEIILCEDNRKDIAEIKAEYLNGLEFIYVRNMQEVVLNALLPEKVKEGELFVN